MIRDETFLKWLRSSFKMIVTGFISLGETGFFVQACDRESKFRV